MADFIGDFNKKQLTIFNRITEGFTEGFRSDFSGNSDRSSGKSCAKFLGLLSKLAQIGLLKFGKILELPPNRWQL